MDNSVAGGIPSGMPKFESIVKESMEEASIAEEIVRKYARSVGSVSYYNRYITRPATYPSLKSHLELIRRVVVPEQARDGCNPKSSELTP